MTATSTPSKAADVLGAFLAAVEASGSAKDARIRGAIKAAQRALREPGVRHLDALADEISSDQLRVANVGVAQERALRAVERHYRRQP
jgi:hypothetical protein